MINKTNQINNFVGQLLIASPSLNDPNFHQTVTYICENDESGSFGLIINRPMETNISEVLNQLNLDTPMNREISLSFKAGLSAWNEVLCCTKKENGKIHPGLMKTFP